MKTKTEMKAELVEIIRTGDRACAATGEAIERIINSLRFRGVGPYVPRGIGDAGLSVKTLQSLCEFRLPYDFFGHVVDYLDA